MTTTDRYGEDDILLLNAYHDGELDASAALALERRLAKDEHLKAYHDALATLRGSMAANLGKEIASDALRARIAGLAGSDIAATQDNVRSFRAAHRRHAGTFDMRQMAASIVMAGLLGSGATLLAVNSGAPESEIAAIVAGHQRALLAAAPVDVASSDRHTVKPWFDAKLAVAPVVLDLTASGYPLAGGRVDIVGGKAVPTMVYRRREHVVSLVAVTRPGSRDEGAAPSRKSRDGYCTMSWHGRDFEYYAVSDLAPAELDSFVAQWRTEAKPK